MNSPGWFGVLAAPILCAEEPSTENKHDYSLFRPTPRELMREMSTDRPDVTESAYTVDAGHLQIELDLAAYARDRHTPERDEGTDAWSFFNANVKLGLTNRSDLQVILPMYQHVRRGPEGFGDISVRLKANLWGNDGGSTALAVMPFIKFPTASSELGNGEIEGGIIVPFAANLGGGWGFGAMVEADLVSEDDASGRHIEFVTSATLGREITESLGSYVELVSVVGTESDWMATVNVGLTYGLTPDMRLDAGINIGLTRAAEDLAPFLGISLRY